MIDSHCHLDFEAFGQDRAQVLARAREAGVTSFICIGSGKDTVSARQAVALAGVESDVFAAVGVHPHDVAHMSDADWAELEGLARAPRVVGIGETGLDYHYNHSPADVQRQAY
jgi:TatD DNase family protein